MESYGKEKSLEILKEYMQSHRNFYMFIKVYSPRDYRYIEGKSYVSHRVIEKHVQIWNETHSHNVKKLRIFFL